MRKRNTSLASLRRPAALLFRLSILSALWHAPLLTIHWHAAANTHHADAGSDHASQLEIEYVLPCQLNGCEHSHPQHGDESEEDHSTHIAAVGYGLLGDAEVDLIDRGHVVDELAPFATMGIPLSSMNEAALFDAAYQAAGSAAPSLPLRADLQVFRI